MLKLRRGVVVAPDPLVVEIAGERRRAWADESLVGACEVGDEVVVNVEAADLGLGSGGFDVVHVNLTRGLEGPGAEGSHVMKLNYTSLQHPVEPIERAVGEGDAGAAAPREMPVLVLPLHGHLAPATWATAQRAPGARVGFVQGGGAALPGSLSGDVAQLRERGLLCDHVTAGSAYGGEGEAISVAGALDAAAAKLGWDAAIVGPGPGIIGSESSLGHGGMAALDAAHAALALRLPTLVSPRLSSGDPRPRHHGLSHHTETVLSLLLRGVRVPAPKLDAALWPRDEARSEPLEQLGRACEGRHDLAVFDVDLEGYAAAGLPTRTMGRELAEDRLFFAAPLAAGTALGELIDEAG